MNAQIKDGGPAFPSTYEWRNDSDMLLPAPNGRPVPPGCCEIIHAPGASLRDLYAGLAMQSILGVLHQGIRPADVPKMCADAWCVADAMLKARAE